MTLAIAARAEGTAGRASSIASISPRFAAKKKRWMGHSDFTAFQLASAGARRDDDVRRPDGRVGLRCGHPFGLQRLDHCWGVLEATGTNSRAISKDRISRSKGRCGAATWRWFRIWLGRRTCHCVDHGILFVEDIGEHPYRIERMLYQLHFAGILARQRAVLLGAFNGYELGPNDNGHDAAAMVAHFRRRSCVHTGLAPSAMCRRKAHAACRRPLRADGARRPRAVVPRTTGATSALTALDRLLDREANIDFAGRAFPSRSKFRSMKCAAPRAPTVTTVEQRAPYPG